MRRSSSGICMWCVKECKGFHAVAVLRAIDWQSSRHAGRRQPLRARQEGQAMASGKTRRSADFSRKTKETEISVSVDLDGSGRFDIKTGVGFFDHMLEQLSRHSLI